MICIDESEDLGGGGYRYFVIAALETTNPNRLKNIVKEFNAKYRHTEIKGSLLTVPQRQDLLNSLNKKDDYSVSYIILDKTHFQRKDILGKNILFNYLTSFLFEDFFKTAKNDLLLCFDNRTVRTSSKHALPEYLMTKCVEWDVRIQINCCFYESQQHRGIQIADLLSNTIFQSYKNETKHFYNQIKIRKSIKFPYQQFGK
jgi:hypothetical protein